MARLARVVAPGLPHLVTQRGSGREPVFFSDEDYRAYIYLMAASVREADCEVWAWCLMPDHVHMIIVPAGEEGLRRALARAHRQYALHINTRRHRTGHLWHGRFESAVIDEDHLALALAYVSFNPVRARLVQAPEDWPWSSVRAHLAGFNDHLTTVAPVLERTGDFGDFLDARRYETGFAPLRRAQSVGRPLGAPGFISSLENRFSRRLKPQKRGPKPGRARAGKVG